MKPIMAICDREVTFTNKLIAMFQEKNDFPFQLHGFTNAAILKEFLENNVIALLVISEVDYEESLKQDTVLQILVLKERGAKDLQGLACINKFQSASSLYKEIMSQYASGDEVVPFAKSKSSTLRIIGFYSPVHRSMQTTMALTMGQILAEHAETLYMNFECFSGLDILIGGHLGGNLTDIMYFYECAKEKLPYRLESIVKNLNGLKILPPANSYQDLFTMAKDTWEGMIEEIGMAGGYSYLILDLSEQMPGLFQVLRMCDRIFTIEKQDAMAMAKIAQYELLLGREHFEDVLDKTEKCTLPIFRQLPQNLERLSKSELAGYVRKLLGKDGIS